MESRFRHLPPRISISSFLVRFDINFSLVFTHSFANFQTGEIEKRKLKVAFCTKKTEDLLHKFTITQWRSMKCYQAFACFMLKSFPKMPKTSYMWIKMNSMSLVFYFFCYYGALTTKRIIIEACSFLRLRMSVIDPSATLQRINNYTNIKDF